MIVLREYVDDGGRSPFTRWFDDLDVPAATKVASALEKIALGNLSNVQSVGSGVSEYKLDWVLDTGFTSGETVKRWSFFWRVEPRSGSLWISNSLNGFGWNIKPAKRREDSDGTHKRLPRNHP